MKLQGSRPSGRKNLAISNRPKLENKLVFNRLAVVHRRLSEQQIAVLQAEHANRGFAFLPHIRDPIQGDITYGDTSMSLEYFRNKFPALKLRTLEHTLDDPYQIVLFLTAR